MTILQTAHERAATVGELATAVGRPKARSRIVGPRAAGLLEVVRTRKVRGDRGTLLWAHGADVPM